jgi:uncharacterized protein DUF4440
MYRHIFMAVALTGLTVAQPKTPPTVTATTSLAAAEAPSPAEGVLAFERSLEAAFVRGDVAYFDRGSRPDLTVIHGDGWINGGKPSSVDDKKSFLRRVESKLYSVRDLDSVTVEMHGDIAITHGRLIAQARTGSPDRSWLSVWYERVYERRDGHWLLVSHRTLHGPTNEPNRASVSER